MTGKPEVTRQSHMSTRRRWLSNLLRAIW